MDMIEVEKEIARATQQLRAELAKEREKVKELEDAYDQAGRTIQVQGRELIAAESRLHEVATHCANKEEQLAAAQATIEQMREALKEVSGLIDESHGVVGLHLNGDEAPWEELLSGGRFERLTMLDNALALPTNLDALHEARALECERLADKSEQGMLLCNELIEEAAAHRAKKGEGK